MWGDDEDYSYGSCEDYETEKECYMEEEDPMYVSSWEDECEFVECDEEGYCWMEHCGDMEDHCGRYSCTLWKYDQRADYWNYSECPNEEEWFDAGAVWDHLQPFFEIYGNAISDEFGFYCPDNACFD